MLSWAALDKTSFISIASAIDRNSTLSKKTTLSFKAMSSQCQSGFTVNKISWSNFQLPLCKKIFVATEIWTLDLMNQTSCSSAAWTSGLWASSVDTSGYVLGALNYSSGTHITESTQRRIWFICICWQHAAPVFDVCELIGKNLTSKSKFESLS